MRPSPLQFLFPWECSPHGPSRLLSWEIKGERQTIPTEKCLKLRLTFKISLGDNVFMHKVLELEGSLKEPRAAPGVQGRQRKLRRLNPC